MALRSLIVDDNAHFLRAASDLLTREGITVVGVASTVEEGVRRAEELRPDITLVDIDLGGESGFDLVERISSPSILISAYAEGDVAELVAASPALGFLGKSELGAAGIRRLLTSTRGT
jgi:CheY-like chemotaxis protein